jgi:ABC-type transporter Mla subunit MlaD
MTVERWTDEMLDRLAMSVDRLAERMGGFAERQEQLSERQEQLSERQEQLSANIASLVRLAEFQQSNFEAILARIDQMQAEVRGLQTENRRILDRLFGPQENEE